MRNRAIGINVRVTPNEKELLQKAAKLCGLSLSDYLRKLGLGREIGKTIEKLQPYVKGGSLLGGKVVKNEEELAEWIDCLR